MNDFLRTPLGAAITGAIGIVVGVFVSGLFGWIDEPGVDRYLLGAAAGFVGGYIGAIIRQRRHRTQSP